MGEMLNNRKANGNKNLCFFPKWLGLGRLAVIPARGGRCAGSASCGPKRQSFVEPIYHGDLAPSAGIGGRRPTTIATPRDSCSPFGDLPGVDSGFDRQLIEKIGAYQELSSWLAAEL
jgi:hypothetical protein